MTFKSIVTKSLICSAVALATVGSGSNLSFAAWQAPIGHRQPRPIDIPVVEPSPSDLALRQENESIDRKLNICRGC
jgi:hypothetical protein